MLARLLHINPDERKRISLFFFQNFFEGLGVAFFYTLSLTYFVEHNPIKQFPWIFITAGITIMVFATIYARFEHHGIPARLFRGLATVIIVFLVICGIALKSSLDPMLLGIGMLALHQVIYYVNKMQFWGMSAITFDVRQSKRLFSVLSVGDLPAKFIGYTLVAGLVASGKISLEQLIYASIASYIVSLLILEKIIKTEPELKLRLGHDEHHHHHHHHADGEHSGGHKLSPIVKGLMGLALVNVFAVTLIEYLFAKEVQHHFEEEGSMVSLISTTLALSYGAATLIKLFVSGRLLQRVNLRILIVSMPVVLIISILTFWAITPSEHKHDNYNYFFIILFVIELILKETLNKPLVLSLYQPLSKAQRLDGHTKVKGYFESGSMVLVGLFLLNTYAHHDHIDLNYSTVVLMIVSVLWVTMGLFFGRVYLKNLRQIIENKLIRGGRALFLDKETAGFLRKKLRSDDELEVINAWDLLQKTGAIEKDDLALMVAHPNKSIRQSAVKLIRELELDPASQLELSKKLLWDEDLAIRLVGLELNASLCTEADWRRLLNEHTAVPERQALYTGWTKRGKQEQSKIDIDEIRRWLNSASRDDQKYALQLIALMTEHDFSSDLKPFLRSDDVELRRMAIAASSAHADQEILDSMIGMLSGRRHTYDILKALGNLPADQLDALTARVEGTGSYTDRKIIAALLNNPSWHPEHLEKQLNATSPHLRNVMASELMDKSDKLRSSRLIKDQLSFEHALLDELNVHWEDQELRKYIEREADQIFTRLLKWCYIYTGEHALLKALEHHITGNDEKMAAVIEALQTSLPQSVFSIIRPHIEDRVNDRKGKIGDVLHLLDNHDRFRDWLIGVAGRKMKPDAARIQGILMRRNSKFLNECLGDPTNTEIQKTMSNTSIKLLERVLMLRQTSMFATTDENYLIEIADVMIEREIPEGREIFREGEEGNSMYIIVSGEVKIEAEGHVLATLKDTEFFGDLSLLDPAPRSATARATRDTIILELNGQAIYELMEDHIDVTRGIIRTLCERLRRQNKQYLMEKQRWEASGNHGIDQAV